MAAFEPNHPPLAEGAQAPNILYGLGDTQASWALFTTPNPLYRTYILPNIGQLPFIREDEPGACMATRNSWYVAAIIGRMRAHVRNLNDETVSMTVALGEYFATDLPANWCLPQNDARMALQRLGRICFGWEQIPDVGTYTTWFNMNNDIYQQITDAEPFNGTNFTRAGLPAAWPFQPQEGLALNSGQWLQLLYLLSNYTREDVLVVMVQHLLTCVLATIKQGNVTRRFLDKITNGVSNELHIEIHLDEDIIRAAYHRLLIGVNDNNISYILNRWFGFLPNEALRLRLTIAQAGGTGLTALNVVGQALIKFPDFCWRRVAGLYRAEWNNFKAAAAVVGNNPWYGYRKDLGPAASTKYISISWIAKELLIRFGNQQTLQQYRGWARRIAHQETVEEWFRQYAEHNIEMEGQALFGDERAWIGQEIPQAAIPNNPVYQ
jgi:hypothetical protein